MDSFYSLLDAHIRIICVHVTFGQSFTGALLWECLGQEATTEPGVT